MTDLDPAVYRKAADVLRTSGWTQGSYEWGGQHCLVGALRVARSTNPRTGSFTTDEPWVRPLSDLLGFVPNDVSDFVARDVFDVVVLDLVIGWNDTAGRTAEDVITLLEQAAEKLEADR